MGLMKASPRKDITQGSPEDLLPDARFEVLAKGLAALQPVPSSARLPLLGTRMMGSAPILVGAWPLSQHHSA